MNALIIIGIAAAAYGVVACILEALLHRRAQLRYKSEFRKTWE